MRNFFDKIKLVFRSRKLIAGIVAVAALSLPFVINQVLKQQDLRQRADTAPSITFNFSPASRDNMTINQTIDVDLVMNAGTNDVGALHFKLKYDPTMLEVTELAQSTALQSIQKSNPPGDGAFEAVMLNPNVTPVTGNNLKVFTFRFKALKAGTATVKIDPDTLQATSQLSTNYLIVDNKTNITGHYTIINTTADTGCNVTTNKPANCVCTGNSDCASNVCGSAADNQSKVCVGSAPSSTITTSPSASPTPTPKEITCHPDSQQITFDMKSPISAKADGPITSVSLTSGNWCAWAAGNNDPNSQGRCPLKCPEFNPATGSTTTTPITLSTDKTTFTSDFDSYYPDNTGSCTYSVSCTASNTSPTLTTTVTTTVTTSPSVTPTQIPTVTLAPGEIGLKLSLKLPGISKRNGENDHPIRTRRTVKVTVYDSTLQNSQEVVKIPEKTGTLDFNSATAQYEGTVGIGTTLATGNYIVKVRMDNTLIKRFPGVVHIDQTKQDNPTPTVELVTGDLNQDNSLGVQDYTNVMACYNHLSACTGDILILGDLDDDGVTNGDNDDINIMQFNTINRQGD